MHHELEADLSDACAASSAILLATRASAPEPLDEQCQMRLALQLLKVACSDTVPAFVRGHLPSHPSLRQRV